MENKTTKSFLDELNEEFHTEGAGTGKESMGTIGEKEEERGEALEASSRKRREKNVKETKDKKPPIQKMGKRGIIAVVIAIPVLIVVVILATKGATQIKTSSELSQKIEKYGDILTDEEKESWRTVKVSDNLFMDFNSTIPVVESSKNATIRLINPPYSNHDFRVTITLNGDEETLLYQSPKVGPGTIINQVTFAESLQAGTYEGTLSYVFYNEDGAELPSYPITVQIEVEA